ncbi:M23 family metallopeptidase [Enterobacter sp. Bisph1]|uniref:M23 family metallopeptidase n=1 Tax=Enterobacter sp. Bisph1 TaxID=1274399 RepID=UPI00057C171B|nr:M23 family metallopeptidase [Enterobacter sp. Bisph1]
MIISPPFIRPRNDGESDASWVARMMPVDSRRNFPLNAHASWHGGVHITHTDTGHRPEMVRAIADGVVISFRRPSTDNKRDTFPLNYNGRTNDGYVLLRHETDIGENCSIMYYSLYMHLRDRLDPAISEGARIWRKDTVGQSGMVDNVNAFHFQVFCDNANMLKLTGRTAPELDITRDGRTDTVYGDIHFYLPAGTRFYESVPDPRSPDTAYLHAVHTSTEPLYVSMTFAEGDCTMVTRRQNSTIVTLFNMVGDPLVNADADQLDNGQDTVLRYEYNLYNTANRLYPQNPSAGFELLRFGRIINTEYETLTPVNAPLWRTVNFPGGTGMVNLAFSNIKKFSDADFPHWTGWRMVDDDTDTNSQCNSPFIAVLQESENFGEQRNRLICNFPLEWNSSTFDQRYAWLKTGADDIPVMSDTDYEELKSHATALCFETGELGTGRMWHFHPEAFISHFRKCCWLSKSELKQLIPLNVIRMARRNNYLWEPIAYRDTTGSMAESIRTHLNKAMQKYLIITPLRIACFLGNAIQETQWLSQREEFGNRQVWYHPWHGRGLLQLTSPSNYFDYFSFCGRVYTNDIKNRLSSEYNRLYANSNIRLTDNRLSDVENDTPDDVIMWRDNVSSNDYNVVSSAGFYWISKSMAYYSDAEHILERCSINTNLRMRIYYRSPAFWKASASVNLPGRINTLYSVALNGFIDRCCVYGSAISVLTEQKFPDINANVIIEKPESNQLRRG